MEDSSQRYGRRELLTMLGAGTLGLSTVGATTARENRFRRDVARARDLRERTGDNEAFVRYLHENGYATSSRTVHETVQLGGGGPSVERLFSDELSATLNLSAWHRNCNPEPYDVYAEYYFEWSLGDGSGEGDRDSFSLGWPASDFQYDEDSHVSSDNVEFYTRDNDLNALSFKYDDSTLGGWGGKSSDSGYGGCYVTPESGYSDDTTFAGKWCHTYDELRICGFSADSSGNSSWSFCNAGQRDYMGYTQLDYGEGDHHWSNC